VYEVYEVYGAATHGPVYGERERGDLCGISEIFGRNPGCVIETRDLRDCKFAGSEVYGIRNLWDHIVAESEI
jgi:hypothetical protein